MAATRESLDTWLLDRRFHEILAEAERARLPGYPPEQAEMVVVYAAMAAAVAGNRIEAGKWAEEGLKLGLNTHLTPWLFHFYGTAQAELGDCYRALRYLARFRQSVAGRPELTHLLGDNWVTTAETHRFLGQDLKSEVSAFGKAARHFTRLGLLDRAADCHAEMAWSYLVRHQTNEAERYLNRLRATPKPRAKILLSRALFHALRGELEEAMTLTARLMVECSLSHPQKVDALWIRAVAHWKAGETQVAWFLAHSARQLSLQPWCPLRNDRITKFIAEMSGTQEIPAS